MSDRNLLIDTSNRKYTRKEGEKRLTKLYKSIDDPTVSFVAISFLFSTSVFIGGTTTVDKNDRRISRTVNGMHVFHDRHVTSGLFSTISSNFFPIVDKNKYQSWYGFSEPAKIVPRTYLLSRRRTRWKRRRILIRPKSTWYEKREPCARVGKFTAYESNKNTIRLDWIEIINAHARALLLLYLRIRIVPIWCTLRIRSDFLARKFG